MDDIITRIKSVIADSGLTSNAFALKVGMNSSNLSRKLNGKVPITSRDYRLICDSIGVNKDWLETGAGDKYIGEPLNGKETMQPVLGVPFYDVEFALGYDELYNDTPNEVHLNPWLREGRFLVPCVWRQHEAGHQQR